MDCRRMFSEKHSRKEEEMVRIKVAKVSEASKKTKQIQQ